VTVAAPYDLAGWLPFVQSGGAFLGGFGSSLLVIRSAGASRDLSIELAAPLSSSPVPAKLVGQDGSEFGAELTTTGRDIPVSVTETADSIFTIEPGTGAPAGPTQIQLLGVTDGR